MRAVVLFFVLAASAMILAAPVAAQDQKRVDWGEFSKNAPSNKDTDWKLILERERQNSKEVDWATFSGKKKTSAETTLDTSASEVETPEAEAAAEPSGEMRYRIAPPESPVTGEGRVPGPKQQSVPASGVDPEAVAAPRTPQPEGSPERKPACLAAPAPAPAPQRTAFDQPRVEPLAPESEPGPPVPASPPVKPLTPQAPLLQAPATPVAAPVIPVLPAKPVVVGSPVAAPADVALTTKPGIEPAPTISTPRRLYSDEALNHFLKLALFDKDVLTSTAPGLEPRAQVLVRWDSPMRLTLVGGSPAARTIATDAAHAVSQALPAQVAGIEFTEASLANATLFILGGYGGGIDGYTENTYRDGMVIIGTRIVLYEQSLTPAIASREILRALGFTGCDQDGQDSVMHCAGGGGAAAQAGLPELDRLALKMLYHPALEPGMNLARAREAVEAMR